MKSYLFALDLPELTEILTSWGEPGYRAAQIWQGLYQNLWDSPEAFTTLSKGLRGRLAEAFEFSHLQPVADRTSSDGETRKILFHLPDGQPIETVRMRYQKRRTLCISTQSGCAMGCLFCATGQMGFRRDLSSGEIVEQVIYFARRLKDQGERVTNIVIMGMGEPLHNYAAAMQAIRRLNHPEGMNLGARRFTLSTVGLPPRIRQLAREDMQINLAISLHAADDELREKIIPINRKYPIAEIMGAVREYARASKRRVTFEWALINQINDTPEQAAKLADLLGGMLAHVNLIPLNPTRGYARKASTRERAERFQEILQKRGVPCTIRLRRGIDIQAGCGQLASEQNGM
ncbi:MAG: 23S rRNA (adenine(2503)-C(2))-methyltransferase RlmN [Chloroflexi bacterium]|nr:23S rRNA (adenine(2503)-C(2))-methyltransferase RlmN [Chloroflexota bacterium]